MFKVELKRKTEKQVPEQNRNDLANETNWEKFVRSPKVAGEKLRRLRSCKVLIGYFSTGNGSGCTPFCKTASHKRTRSCIYESSCWNTQAAIHVHR
ncbi:hypothetical protein ACLKA7_017207 [Drosophila subpalustris]